MVSLWRIYHSKKYWGRAYWKKGYANLFLPSLYEQANSYEEDKLRWFVFWLLDTLHHEEIHLVLYGFGEGGHASEKTIITPAGDALALAIARDVEMFEEWMQLFSDLPL